MEELDLTDFCVEEATVVVDRVRVTTVVPAVIITTTATAGIITTAAAIIIEEMAHPLWADSSLVLQ